MLHSAGVIFKYVFISGMAVHADYSCIWIYPQNTPGKISHIVPNIKNQGGIIVHRYANSIGWLDIPMVQSVLYIYACTGVYPIV